MKTAACAVLALWVMYVFYLAIMRLKESGKPKLERPVQLIALSVVLVGGALNLVINWGLASAIFLDRPRELWLSDRLRRYQRGPHGWRRRAASWVCRNLLNPFDPDGTHC